MTDQKDNYIPDEDTPRPQPAMPNRPADEGDEDVLAGLARLHASHLRTRQTDNVSPEVVSPAEPPVSSKVEMPVVSPAETFVASGGESPLRKAIDVLPPDSPEVFRVRQARRKSLHKSSRGESVRRLIIHFAVVAALTGLAVALFFLTR